MIRRVIQIDREKCNGCGACVAACHEGAIALVEGKAQLMRDDYCDGLGDCLPNCPTGAISFIEREAAAYNEAAVLANKLLKTRVEPRACPGATAKTARAANNYGEDKAVSQLRQWPCQIKLAPINAPFFEGARLLIAADCSAYAYANIHQDFMRGRVTLIGCPKLDAVDYAEKLGEILAGNDIEDVTLLRMTVPCCGGLEHALKRAIRASGRDIPLSTVTIDIDGRIV